MKSNRNGDPSFNADDIIVVGNLYTNTLSVLTIAEVCYALAGRLKALPVVDLGCGQRVCSPDEAIQVATVLHPGLRLLHGTADKLP